MIGVVAICAAIVVRKSSKNSDFNFFFIIGSRSIIPPVAAKDKIKDMEKFKRCVEEKNGLTFDGLIQKSGMAMSRVICSCALKRLAITKKDLWI